MTRSPTALFRSRTARGLGNLYAGTLISGSGWAMVLPVTPVLADHFDVTAGTAAQVVTAYALGRFFGIPAAGVLIDHFGTRTMLIGGPGLVLLGALVGVFTPWFWPILVGIFVVGAGDSLWSLGREVAGIDLVRLDQRGRVLSGFHGMHSGALAIGPLFGGLLADSFDFRATFAGFAALTAVAVALGVFAHDAHAPQSASRPSDAPSGGLARRLRGFADLFQQIHPGLRMSYWVFVLATFAGFTFRITLQSVLPLYADEELGLTPTEIGFLFSISGGVVFAMILPAGFVLDKLGRKWATVPSTFLPGIAFLLMPFVDTYAHLAVLVGAMAVFNGLSLGSLAASTYDVLPDHVRGRLQAFRRTTAEVGGVSAPLLGGVLLDTVGPTAPFIAYAPVLLIAGLLLAFATRETLVKRPPA
ncbi:MAG: MFS transporter [Chloroflexota bacterium]|nr:MFS transporter [Chloroflexota bacterium]MDE2884436.1 MFS transporter [Chloroflexota bacterium]